MLHKAEMLIIASLCLPLEPIGTELLAFECNLVSDKTLECNALV